MKTNKISEFKEILSDMSVNEIKLFKLYSIFEKKFPLKKIFWKNIAAQESIHSKIINELIENLENGLITINKKILDKDSVKDFSNYIDDRIENDLNNCDSHQRALEIALLIEENFLESKMFQVFIIDPRFLNPAFKTLIAQTRDHVNLIKNELTKEKLYNSSF